MSVNVPLHKWRSADPAILIGRRCIAQTDQDVIIDGRLELIRHPDGTIYGCICPNCRHKCILHVDGRSLNKAIRLWNHHASHHQRNEQ